MTAMELPAAEFDSQDCRWPGCPSEARHRHGMCDDHHGQHATGNGRPSHETADGRVIPGALEYLMHDDEPPHDEPAKEKPVPTCKIDGCDNAPIDSRGPYSGLCQPHKREKAAAMGAARRKPSVPAETAPVPPQVEHGASPNGHTPLTLTQLAQAVDEASEDLVRAQRTHTSALAALRQAVEAA